MAGGADSSGTKYTPSPNRYTSWRLSSVGQRSQRRDMAMLRPPASIPDATPSVSLVPRLPSWVSCSTVFLRRSFFSKLERVLNHCQVTFCSSACLQFGSAALYTRGSKGVYGQFWMKNNSIRSLQNIDSESSSDSGCSPTPSIDTFVFDRGRKSSGVNDRRDFLSEPRSHCTVPFPFLEFRLVNDHANSKNRAIVNARANAMVQLSAEVDNEGDHRDPPERKESNRAVWNSILIAPTDGKEPTSPTIHDNDGIGRAMVVQETDNDGQGGGPEGRVYYPLELGTAHFVYLHITVIIATTHVFFLICRF